MVINMIMTGTNKFAKTIKSLKERKYREETGLFIAEGLRFVNEIPDDYDLIADIISFIDNLKQYKLSYNRFLFHELK